MKKILSTIFIGLLCLSMFPMFAPHVKAESAYLTDIVQLTTNPFDDRGAGWSPDSSKIAYGAFADSWYRHIWVMNHDGSGKTQLTFGNVVDSDPAYSPDGTKIVFMRYGLRGIDGSDLMMMDANGDNAQPFTSTGLHRGQPKWSHDGHKLAFYYGGAGTNVNEIHVMGVETKDEITLVSSPYPYMNVYWSPDDSKLVYSMDDGIWLADTSPPYQKTRVFQTSLPTMYAVFSPDGKYIMYASGVFGQLQDLYLIDIYGNFIAQLTYDTKFGYDFDWSPDGQYIAFNSISSGNYDVWRARIVIEGAGARSPVGYWKFDEGQGSTANDASGNGNTGTFVGVPQWVNGIAGTALEFDGVDDVVMVPDSASLVVARAQNQLTLETWIKPTVTLDSSTTPMFLILKGNEYGFELNDAGDAYTPPTMDGKIRFCMCLVNQSTNYLQPEEIRTNTNVWTAGIWYHLAATYDGNSLEIYVNGILENSRQLTGILWPTSYGGILYPLSIAAYTIGPHYTGGNLMFFKGILDEIKVYNYAKTADEIQNDYASATHPRVLAWGWSLHVAQGIDREWTFPSGGTFTFRSWLQSKGYSVVNENEAFPDGVVTLARLRDFSAILLYANVLGQPGNNVYDNLITDYVDLGGGLIIPTNYDDPGITIDDAFGFSWIADPWSYLVDAIITDPTHPMMQGITELPKAAGFFLDWDALINEAPLPLGTAVLARSIGYPPDKIALVAFQHGAGKVVVGPADGLMRPYGPTNMDWWDVISEPAIENKLLINAINWVAGARSQPDWAMVLRQAQQRKIIYTKYYEKAFNDQWWRDEATGAITRYLPDFSDPLKDSAQELFISILLHAPEMSHYLGILGDAYTANQLLISLASWMYYQGISDALMTASWSYNLRSDINSLITSVDSVISASETQSIDNLNTALNQEKVATERLYQGSSTFDFRVWYVVRNNQGSMSIYPQEVKHTIYWVIRNHICGLRTSLEASYPELTWLLGNQRSISEAVSAPIESREHVPIVLNAYWTSGAACITTAEVLEEVTAHIVVSPNSTAYDPLKTRGKVTLNVLKERPWWWGGSLVWKSMTVDVSLGPGQTQEIVYAFTVDEASSWTFYGYYLNATFSGCDPLSDSFFTNQAVRWQDGGGYAMANGYPPRLRATGQGMTSANVIVSQEIQGKLYLHVYDQYNNHVGMNYQTNQVELGIPDASYYDDGNGMITIGLSQATVNFTVVMDARYAEYPIENYSLSIITIDNLEISSQHVMNYSIKQGEKQEYGIISVGEELRTVSWEYVFRDSKRGTTLKISTDDKYFQFIAPGKDFGVKNDPKMILYRNTVTICYNDKEICMAAIATTGQTKTCAASVLDKSTRKIYLLISTGCRSPTPI